MKKITLLLMVAIAAINISAATIVIPEEAKAWNIPAEAIDVLQAREICAELEADVPTTENYYVMGYVKRVSSKNAETVSQYGQGRSGAHCQSDLRRAAEPGLAGFPHWTVFRPPGGKADAPGAGRAASGGISADLSHPHPPQRRRP